jgi:outer membrane protein assembly factor BamA
VSKLLQSPLTRPRARFDAARWAALLALALTCACASIPKQRYGIESLKFRGMKELDGNAVRACLASEQREKLTLGLGALASPNCGAPPFDKKRWSARMFALPWTEWPVYDEAVFKLDLDRIERWYQARGYYGVRVLDVEFKPTEARVGDGCKEGQDCSVDITVNIEEGEPVRIRKLALQGDGDGSLPPELAEDLLDAFKLEQGDIFDEGLYDEALERVADELREDGYARAAVMGDIEINRGLLVADIILKVVPGPLCYIGDVRISSKVDIPTGPVLAATLLRKGQLYRESSLEDAQRSIYGLGAFSAVTVRGNLATEGPTIPVEIDIEPRRQSLVMLGTGILAGTVSSGVQAEESISVPQWDVHLLGSYEHRNFMGGLRRFKIEERPRMLFLGPFPGVPDGSPRFGNTITANFSQPGVFEPRTNLFVETRWDNGPDPFLLFFRNDVGMAIGFERGFWKQRLSARVAVHQEIMEVARRQPLRKKINDKRAKISLNKEIERIAELEELTDPEDRMPDPKPDIPPPANCRGEGDAWWGADRDPDAPPPANPMFSRDDECIYERYLIPSSYRLFFLEQRVTLDLRDDSVKPTKGGYFRLAIHEAVRVWDPSWTYIRVLPEARGYAPLGLGLVLAGRIALGSLHVLNRSKKLDQQSAVLGAQPYRLRGGGANSVRGFGPGELGDGRSGGIRRWEASLELRVPLSKDFYIVGFGDMGDVYAGRIRPRTRSANAPRVYTVDEQFRWNHLNTTVGAGLRYYTVIGPIRLDVGWRPRALGWASSSGQQMNLGFTKFEGAVHLTIGESF